MFPRPGISALGSDHACDHACGLALPAQAPFLPCRTVLCVIPDALSGLGCSHRVATVRICHLLSRKTTEPVECARV